jgi:hypothetical protein
LGEVDRRVHVQLEQEPAAPQRQFGGRRVEGCGGVVDEDVDGTE